MLNHNLKVSIRNFKRYQTSFLINLIGLVVGLVASLFIYLWVNHEMRMDTFHEDSGQLYRLVSDAAGNETLLNSSPRFAGQLRSEIPEIQLMVNSSWGQLESILVLNREAYSLKGEFGSKDFFKLFSYPLLTGNAESLLVQPNSIVISESTAIKLFNSTDVIGQTLEWRWYSAVEKVTITGIYRDLPLTSSSQFDYVLSFNIFEQRFKERIERGNRNGRTFIKLAKGTSVEQVNAKIFEISRRDYPENTSRPPFLIGYSDYYLHNLYENGRPNGGRIALVQLFIAIGVLIILIACINFMNLSTARAALRTKEIGVRKVIGAHRRSLIYQYLTESCTLSFLAGIIAIVFVALLFPYFQQLIGQKISVEPDLNMIFVFLGIVSITGIVAGSYPALYLSGFNPLLILKGKLTTSNKDQWLRQGLVVFQFGASLVLIISVLVVYHQMKYVQNKSLGYKSDNILNFETVGMNAQKQQAFLSEVKNVPGVVKASGISHALFGAQKSSANITWEGKDPEQDIWFEWGYVDYDMLELLKIKLDKGRFFSREFGNENAKVVINKTTQKLIGVDNPIGLKLSVGDSSYEIIGVMSDFHFQSLHEQIKPTFFLLNNGWSMKLAISITAQNRHQCIQYIEEMYKKFNPENSFDYSFHDQEVQERYKNDEKVATLSKYASTLAIPISCLGLFGLVSFVAERRSKEMSIRKVLGASPSSLIGALSKDFTLPLSLSTIIGSLISIYLMSNWLAGFAYRIELEWWFFAFSIVLLFLFALLISTVQIIKTITTNPIDSIRDE
ncbi:MAG: ABC transporter permease [Cyclobacteriaceae bacterium]|nr:ABC transporter permease [Cyclobacteriaceae bacterium HetDA_MAG_MS6]